MKKNYHFSTLEYSDLDLVYYEWCGDQLLPLSQQKKLSKRWTKSEKKRLLVKDGIESSREIPFGKRFLCLSQAKYLPLSALVTIPKKSRRHNIDIGAAMIFNLFSSFSSSSSASCNKREFELDYLVCIKNWKECVHREPIDHLESTTTNWSNGFSQHVSNS